MALDPYLIAIQLLLLAYAAWTAIIAINGSRQPNGEAWIAWKLKHGQAVLSSNAKINHIEQELAELRKDFRREVVFPPQPGSIRERIHKLDAEIRATKLMLEQVLITVPSRRALFSPVACSSLSAPLPVDEKEE